MSEMIERVARAVCANSPGSFCRDVGGDLGCKNGRGVAPHWSNCIASTDQLGLCGHASAARATIEAMRGPTEVMVTAERGVEMLSNCEGDPTADYPDAPNIWRAMVDAALGTPSSAAPLFQHNPLTP